MACPPGREPIIDYEAIRDYRRLDPELVTSISELASWIDYLLEPETHDGPRVYTCHACGLRQEADQRSVQIEEHTCGAGTPPLEISSVFRDVDVRHFFYAADAFSGIRQEKGMEAAYDNLVLPYLCVQKGKEDIEYPAEMDESNSRRVLENDLFQMRSGWDSDLSDVAYEFEKAFIEYAVGHENCMYAIAEAITRYRAIFAKARDELDKQNKELLKTFQEKHGGDRGDGTPLTLFGVLLTVLVTAATTVISGGQRVALTTSVAALGAAAAPGSGTRTAQVSWWPELAREYFAEVDRIGDEAFHAVQQLRDKLEKQLNAIMGKHGTAPPALPPELGG